jgi:hypothetical protein
LFWFVVVFIIFGIHNPGVGGSNPPIATIQIKRLGENQVLFLCLEFSEAHFKIKLRNNCQNFRPKKPLLSGLLMWLWNFVRTIKKPPERVLVTLRHH